MKSMLNSANIVVVLLCLAAMAFMTMALDVNPYAVKISTFAGGNGEFVDPQKLARLSNGDIIVSDARGHSIKRINATSGVVTTIAGTGVAGFSGDGDLAVNAKLNKPFGIAVSSNDEIYIADSVNHRIRKIDVNGNISTVVGTTQGFSGNDGLATACQLNTPMDVSISSTGELYIADMYNHRVRKVLIDGTIVAFAGSGADGYIGDNGPALNASLALIYGVRVFSNGEVYISDSHNFKVRKVDVNGTITTVAGTGSASYNGDNILATAANLNHPTDVLLFDSGELVIADADNYRVRLVMTNGTIITTAGNGTASFSDGEIAEASGLSIVTGFVMTQHGLLVADAGNARIRLLQSRVYQCFGISNLDAGVCSGHGACVDNDDCQCNNNYHGNYCNETTCNGVSSSDASVCSSKGSCVAYDSCSCKTGYSGSNCSTTTCFQILASNGSACSGNGACVDYNTCQCSAGFTGQDCSSVAVVTCYGVVATDKTVCNGQGSCISNNVCSCNNGYEGPTCLPSNLYISTVATGFVDPQKLARLSNGDVIVSDATGHAVKKINLATGVVTTIAGTGVAGFSGDGDLAVNAKLNKPYGIAVSSNDEIYIADSVNHRIRKIDVNGNISTVVGTTSGFSGDNGLATACQLNTPMDVSISSTGELYIVDMYNHRVRKVLTNGTIVTFAGSGASGYIGDNGPAINAALSNAYGVRVVPSGEVYISDSNNFKVRKVDLNGTITTVAGTGVGDFNGDYKLATSTNFNRPQDVVFLPTGEMLITDVNNFRLRMVLVNGTVVTIAGTGVYGSSGDYGLAKSAGLSLPAGILVTEQGILITDTSSTATTGSVRILTVTNPLNYCYGVAANNAKACNGNGKCISNNVCSCNNGYEGPTCLPSNLYISTVASGLVDPQKLARLSNGDVIVSDATGHAVKKINLATGVVTTIAGTGVAGFSGDGDLAVNAKLNKPYGIAVSSNDEIYIADSVNHRIRKIDINGNISTVVGTTSGFSGDNGLATACQLNTPMDVSISSTGELYIVDMYNHRIRKVLTNGTIVTFAGSGASGYIGDNGPAINAALSNAYAVRVIPSGEVYISDSNNFKVRKVDLNGTITTVAGTGSASYNGDNILATAANLNHPTDVVFLPTGEMLIADTDNYRIRMVLVNGTIVTLSGLNTAGFAGDFGLAKSGKLNCPTGILVLPNGDILIADAKNGRVRLISATVPYPKCNGILSTTAGVCSSHGQCVDVDTCQCNAGYSGSNCEFASCFGVNSTNALVCSGRGKCPNIDTCQCDAGYSGFNCNVTSCFGISADNALVCSGHGSCVSLDTCQCASKYSGSVCNVTEQAFTCDGWDSTDVLHVCTGHGSCIAKDVCNCTSEYVGTYCEIPVSSTCFGLLPNDKQVCSGHGACLNGVCSCYTGYSGSQCSVSDLPPQCFGIDADSANVCSGHGSCLNGSCICKTGYSGSQCSVADQPSTPQCANSTLGVDTTCSSHGACTSDVCKCDSHYFGKYCSINSMLMYNANAHPLLGFEIHAVVDTKELTDVQFTWAQTSGQTIANLDTVASSGLKSSSLVIPGSLNSAFTAGNSYGFTVTIKVTTSHLVETFSASATVQMIVDPILTFTVQNDKTGQNITSGVATSTPFRVTITSNSKKEVVQYGFGYADGSSLVLLAMSQSNVGVFTLPYIAGHTTLEIYVASYAVDYIAVQKLTTITVTNPVSDLPVTQAINTISNLISSNSSVSDLLGAASLLNSVSTTDSTQVTEKQNLRSSIISNIAKSIASGDLTPAIKALSTVTSVSSEITTTSADKALDTMISGTTNPHFSRNDVDSLVTIASNVATVSSDSKSSTFGNSLGSKLVSIMSIGDVISSSGSNFGLAVSRGVSSISLGSVKMGSLSSTRATAGLECYFTTARDDYYAFFTCLSNSNWVARPKGERKYAPGTEREIRDVTYTVGSLVFDMTPMYDNGTALSGNVTSVNNIQITFPYTGSLTPVCGIVNSDTTYTVNKQATLVKGNGSVTCKTKLLKGNVLLLATSTPTASPIKSTVVGGTEQTSKFSALFMCVMLIISMFLF